MSKSIPFEDMASLIRHNEESMFGGAVVVVPPGNGEPIVFMLTDPKGDVVQFWSTVETRVKISAAEAMQAATQNDPWRR